MDWKDFLKPTKQKILILFALLLMHLIVFFYYVFVQPLFRPADAVFVALALTMPLIWIIGGISSLIWGSINIFSFALGYITFLPYWWLISCIVYLLASFASRRFGLTGVVLVFILVMFTWIIAGEALLVEKYNHIDPFLKCVNARGFSCGFNVLGFSNISVSGYTCGSFYLSTVKNTGNSPITLKSLTWMNDGHYKSLDNYLAPGGSIDIDKVGGFSGSTPSELKVTYIRMTDGKTIEETGQMPEYPSSQSDTHRDYPGKISCVIT